MPLLTILWGAVPSREAPSNSTEPERGLQQTADGVQGGGFAGAVRADQGDDLTLVYIKGNALDGVDAAIVNLQIIDTQQTHVQPSLFLPR